MDESDAREFHLSNTGCGDHDMHMIKELSNFECDEHYILDTDNHIMDQIGEYDEDDFINGYKKIETFSEYMNHNTITDMVATTEF